MRFIMPSIPAFSVIMEEGQPEQEPVDAPPVAAVRRVEGRRLPPAEGVDQGALGGIPHVEAMNARLRGV